MNLNLKPLAIALFLTTVLSACGNSPQQSISLKQEEKSKLASAQGQESNKQVQLEYGEIWTQKKSEYVIIPVGYKTKSNKRAIDYSASSGYSASKSSILRGQNLSAVNLMFHGQQNDRTHLLLEQNAFITEFDYLVDANPIAKEITPGASSSCKPPAQTPADHSFDRLMIYKTVEQDTNQNKALDLGDANKGYLSDLTGKNLRSLTPDSTKLTQWHCDYQRNQLLLFVQELNPQPQKNAKNSLALYIYDLSINKLTRITPPKSNLENWKINLDDGLMYLYSRLDGNSDRQYNSADETRVIKYNLDSQQTIEINDPQIRQSLNK